MNKSNSPEYRGWQYAKLGDYHRNLDPNWSYTPTYLKKMAFIRKQVLRAPKTTHILDAGCGEGVLVETFRKEGYLIDGLDLNFENEFVRKGSILDMPYEDGSFDIVLLLDVLEHLAFADQPAALAEIHRILEKRGMLVAAIPNLAHWNSRFRMAFWGRLDRTDNEIDHLGERPFVENRDLLLKAGFTIEHIRGVTLTVPFIYRRVICRHPAAFKWLHDLLEPLAIPSLAMVDIFLCQRA